MHVTWVLLKAGPRPMARRPEEKEFAPFCASHFQACYGAINNFGKLGIKENLAEKLKQIGQIEVTPDCEEVLRTKICRKYFRKVTVLGNGVKKSTTVSIMDFFSVFSSFSQSEIQRLAK